MEGGGAPQSGSSWRGKISMLKRTMQKKFKSYDDRIEVPGYAHAKERFAETQTLLESLSKELAKMIRAQETASDVGNHISSILQQFGRVDRENPAFGPSVQHFAELHNLVEGVRQATAVQCLRHFQKSVDDLLNVDFKSVKEVRNQYVRSQVDFNTEKQKLESLRAKTDMNKGTPRSAALEEKTAAAQHTLQDAMRRYDAAGSAVMMQFQTVDGKKDLVILLELLRFFSAQETYFHDCSKQLSQFEHYLEHLRGSLVAFAHSTEIPIEAYGDDEQPSEKVLKDAHGQPLKPVTIPAGPCSFDILSTTVEGLRDLFTASRPSSQELLLRAKLTEDSGVRARAPSTERLLAPMAMKAKPQKPKKAKVFGAPLESFGTRGVPPVLLRCIEGLRHKNAHQTTEGIFRVSAESSKVDKAKFAFETGQMPDLRGDDPHVASGVLKAFLRELPDPLCTYDLYKDFVHAVARTDEGPERVAAVQEILGLLSPQRLEVLATLSSFLAEVAEAREVTLMDSRNLGIVFGPTILAAPPAEPQLDLVHVQDVQNVAKTFIDASLELFGSRGANTVLSPDPPQMTVDELADWAEHLGFQEAANRMKMYKISSESFDNVIATESAVLGIIAPDEDERSDLVQAWSDFKVACAKHRSSSDAMESALEDEESERGGERAPIDLDDAEHARSSMEKEPPSEVSESGSADNVQSDADGGEDERRASDPAQETDALIVLSSPRESIAASKALPAHPPPLFSPQPPSAPPLAVHRHSDDERVAQTENPGSADLIDVSQPTESGPAREDAAGCSAAPRSEGVAAPAPEPTDALVPETSASPCISVPEDGRPRKASLRDALEERRAISAAVERAEVAAPQPPAEQKRIDDEPTPTAKGIQAPVSAQGPAVEDPVPAAAAEVAAHMEPAEVVPSGDDGDAQALLGAQDHEAPGTEDAPAPVEERRRNSSSDFSVGEDVHSFSDSPTPEKDGGSGVEQAEGAIGDERARAVEASEHDRADTSDPAGEVQEGEKDVSVSAQHPSVSSTPATRGEGAAAPRAAVPGEQLAASAPAVERGRTASIVASAISQYEQRSGSETGVRRGAPQVQLRQRRDGHGAQATRDHAEIPDDGPGDASVRMSLRSGLRSLAAASAEKKARGAEEPPQPPAGSQEEPASLSELKQLKAQWMRLRAQKEQLEAEDAPSEAWDPLQKK